MSSSAKRAKQQGKRHRVEDSRNCFVSWNVDGLRALLRHEAGVQVLRELLAARPIALCLLEHKLQETSTDARQQLENLGKLEGYRVHWTFSPRAGRDGVAVMVQEDAGVLTVEEPALDSAACTAERRLLTLEFDRLFVVFVYAPNSGRPGRLAFRTDEWEPAIRRYLSSLGKRKPLLYQGDLNVAHVRTLDAWGTTAAQFGNYQASGRTREEAAALDLLLDECGLVDGFRSFQPHERSATCWAQKKVGHAQQREHWKRYDYALASETLLRTSSRGVANNGTRQPLQLVAVRHLGDAFDGGRPDHVPVESELSGLLTEG
jgi:exodeoxyribonuclease III